MSILQQFSNLFVFAVCSTPRCKPYKFLCNFEMDPMNHIFHDLILKWAQIFAESHKHFRHTTKRMKHPCWACLDPDIYLVQAHNKSSVTDTLLITDKNHPLYPPIYSSRILPPFPQGSPDTSGNKCPNPEHSKSQALAEVIHYAKVLVWFPKANITTSSMVC